MSLNKVATLMAAGLLLAACQTAESGLREAGGGRLAGNALVQALEGVTFDARNTSGQRWYEYHASDGMLYAGGGDRDRSWIRKGIWWIADGEYCLTMRHWSRGTERCQPVYALEDDRLRTFWSDGSRYMTASTAPGDTQGLADQHAESLAKAGGRPALLDGRWTGSVRTAQGQTFRVDPILVVNPKGQLTGFLEVPESGVDTRPTLVGSVSGDNVEFENSSGFTYDLALEKGEGCTWVLAGTMGGRNDGEARFTRERC